MIYRPKSVLSCSVSAPSRRPSLIEARLTREGELADMLHGVPVEQPRRAAPIDAESWPAGSIGANEVARHGNAA